MISAVNKKEILVDSILDGWERAEEFIRRSQYESGEFQFKPEYLISVKIADSIVNTFYKNGIGEKYSVILEDNTKYAFQRRNPEVIEYDQVGFPLKLRGKEKCARPGRFDITIYENDFLCFLDSYNTYCIIEIKNYNGKYSSIQKDINRIRNILTANNTSSIEYGYMTFSLYPNKKDWAKLIDNDEIIQKKYLKRVKDHLQIDKDCIIKTLPIYKLYSEDDFSVIQYLFLIFVIIFEKSIERGLTIAST